MPSVMRAVLLVALLLRPEAHAASLRAQCRVQCKPAIQACVAAGGKRRRCRRALLRQCRQGGLAVCVGTGSTVTTTTATTSSSLRSRITTTTLGTIYGCDATSTADLRGQSSVTVSFGDALGSRYDPSCFMVSPGT